MIKTYFQNLLYFWDTECLLLKDHFVICIIYINYIKITGSAGGGDPKFAFIAEFIDSSLIPFISKFLSKEKQNLNISCKE